MQACDIGFVVIGSLGDTHGFAGKRGDLRFMPVAFYPDLRLLDVRMQLPLLVGGLRQLFIRRFEPREYLSILTGSLTRSPKGSTARSYPSNDEQAIFAIESKFITAIVFYCGGLDLPPR